MSLFLSHVIYQPQQPWRKQYMRLPCSRNIPLSLPTEFLTSFSYVCVHFPIYRPLSQPRQTKWTWSNCAVFQIENKQFSKTNLMSVILHPLILRKRGSLSSGAEGGRWVTFQATDKPKPWKIHSILPAFFVSYVRLSLHCPLIICPLPLTRWKSISLPCSFIHSALVAPVPSVTW